MAQTVTLQGLRDQMIHSLYGRKVGIAFGVPNGSSVATFKEDTPDYIVGIKDFRRPITVTLTSATTATSTADQIPNYGIALFNTSSWASTAFNPVNPVPGVSVQLFNLTSAQQIVNVNNSTLTTAVTCVMPGSSAAGGSSVATQFMLNSYGWAELYSGYA